MSGVSAVIFGGTSEGRELAEFASAHQIPVLVSVVTEYGETLLEESPHVRVRLGALNEAGMERLLEAEAPGLVLDATHPYARVVTGQLEALCQRCAVPYRRVVREESAMEERADRTSSGPELSDPGLFLVSSAGEAAAKLAEDREPVLLTTGSKELELFAGAEHLAGRIFARVLPDSKVLEKCRELGINGSHVIAMQGPFSEEMNRAILRQTGAKWLVTKESGSRGGFQEKVRAARDCGCRVIVIERPVKEQGITLSEAKVLLLEQENGRRSFLKQENRFRSSLKQEDRFRSSLKQENRRRISLIGMGMGGGRQLTLEAAEALKSCDAVLGAPRMVKDVEGWCDRARKEPLYLADQIAEWLEAHPECRNVGVVYSGDTGFYSGSSSLLERLGGRQPEGAGDESGMTGEFGDWQVQVYPGISSVSSLSARMQVSWEHMYLASAHGRDCDVAELVRQHSRLFLLLGGAENLGSVCEKLVQAGFGDVKVTAGVRMGYPDERLMTGTAGEFAGEPADELAAAVFERNEVLINERTGGKPEVAG